MSVISPSITNSMGIPITRPIGEDTLPINEGFYLIDNTTTDFYLIDNIGGRLIIQG